MYQYKNKYQCGYVTVWVLVLLLVLSTLLSCLFLTVEQLSIISKHQYQKMTNEIDIANLLKRIVETTDITACLYHLNITDSALTRLDEKWWKLSSCTILSNNERYYYFIEQLEPRVCAFIINTESDHDIQGGFYRISLINTKFHSTNGVEFWRATYVMQSIDTMSCENTGFYIAKGIHRFYKI